MRNSYTILRGNPERKRQLQKNSLNWEDNIKNDFKNIGCVDEDSIQPDQDKVDLCVHVHTGHEPPRSTKGRKYLI
jgi:hypothetical protein